jgi:hypothetical protein
MDLSQARFTTTIDLRLGPALRGTLENASRRWLNRMITFAGVILIWSYTLRLFVAQIDLRTSLIGCSLAFIVFYLLTLGLIALIIRRQALARYGTLPATVQVQLTETGFEVEYPRQPIRHESFEFVNNWWLNEESSQIMIVLGRRPVERCVIAIEPNALDEPTRAWLLDHLRARA